MTAIPDPRNECLGDRAFDAAREFIRLRHEEDGCVIGIWEVLGHLDERFGQLAGLTTDVEIVLGLCVDLWEDPNIHQVADGWLEFLWIPQGDRQREEPPFLRSRLLERSDPEALR